MIDLGYMAKRVAARPEQFPADHVADIYSVCNCISDDFADYIELWMHNDFWFFDSPEKIRSICAAGDIAMSDFTVFFYRGYKLQFDETYKQWKTYSGESAGETNVEAPASCRRIGYDVVTYSMQNAPECSPLSCNYLATDIPVNQHCLIDSLEDAIKHLENGAFNNSEPGPFRIIEVNIAV